MSKIDDPARLPHMLQAVQEAQELVKGRDRGSLDTVLKQKSPRSED